MPGDCVRMAGVGPGGHVGLLHMRAVHIRQLFQLGIRGTCLERQGALNFVPTAQVTRQKNNIARHGALEGMKALKAP